MADFKHFQFCFQARVIDHAFDVRRILYCFTFQFSIGTLGFVFKTANKIAYQRRTSIASDIQVILKKYLSLFYQKYIDKIIFFRSAVVPETKTSPGKIENGRTMENPSSGENVAMNQMNQVGEYTVYYIICITSIIWYYIKFNIFLGYNTNTGYDNEGYYNTDQQWNPNTAWGEESSNQPQPAQTQVTIN